MQFNEQSLKNKQSNLDIIFERNDLLEYVLKQEVGKEYSLKNIPRVWEPGGGSTLYILSVDEKKYFLKVKHKSVTVESKLEEEVDFLNESSLEHEKEMMERLKERFIPKLLFFAEKDDIQFLATEYIEYSLVETLSRMSCVREIVALWKEFVGAVKKMYSADMVHCDLHENNIRCREDGSIVIIDFEECRILGQKEEFENSLDYVGTNGTSSLGLFPLYEQDSDFITNYNCVLRMREVFKLYVLKLLPELIKQCNYDSTNGICTALDHGRSDKIYQSINTKYCQVEGQRGFSDSRAKIVKNIAKILFKDQKYTFIDVGSNNGNFCREIAEQEKENVKCIGLEGFSKFNNLAEAITFLEGYDNIEYLDFVCGEDDFSKIEIEASCFMTICSVWHHIKNKDVFLEQIKVQNIEYILFELAVQSECYENHTWQEELEDIIKRLEFEMAGVITYSKDYKRPLVLLSKRPIASVVWDAIKNVISS